MLFRVIICAGLLGLFAGCATTPSSTATTPDALLKDGDRLSAARRYEDAINQWKKIRETDAPPELVSLAELKIADAQFDHKSYIEATASYENFRKLHPSHEKAPYALYRLGMCYFKQVEGIDTEQTAVKNAVTMFESFLRQYPSSQHAAEVRAKLEDCRTKQLEYEIYVGRFYFRSGKYQAAIKRLEEALVQFPSSAKNDETLYYLGNAYLKKGERKKAEQVLNRLLVDFPTSKFVKGTREVLAKS